MPRDADGHFFTAKPALEHWEAVRDNQAQQRALFNLAAHSQAIHTVERDDAGKMLVGYTNGAGVRRTAIYDVRGRVVGRRDWR